MIEFISQLPTEYQEVEYIESSGTQYIDTGYKPTSNNLRIACEFEYTADHSASSVFGSESSGQYSIVPWGAPEFYVGSSTRLLAQTTALNTKYLLDAHANAGTLTVSLNGTTNSASYSGSILTTVNMGIFCNIIAGVANQFCSMKLYAMYIYDNGNLVRDFVPCYRKADNVAGLYDLVNNVFYTNAGSGVFAVGADSNKHAIATIIPGGVISFGAALRRRPMLNVKWGLTISGLPLGALIRAEDGGNGTANYEIVGFDIFSPGDCVLTRKTKYTTASYGSIKKYADSSIDKRCNDTIYNAFSAGLRAKIMDVVFYLASDGQITRRVFVPTATMVGNGGNEGVAFPYFNSDERRAKGEEWWTSTIYTKDYMRVVRNDGYITIGLMRSSYTGVVPTFVIPASTRYDPVPNDDGSYNLVL